MNGESTSLFKIFRVLWFPMSINATVLGASAAVSFFAGTWVACWLAGGGGLAKTATTAFLQATEQMIVTATWPGFATREAKDGTVVHHLLDAEAPSAADRASIDDDVRLVNAVLGGYIAERREAIERDGSQTAEQRREARNDLQRLIGRYRLIYAAQVALFFLFLATFGVAICRILALRIARDEYCTLAAAWSYAWRVKLTGILFPVAVALPIVVLSALNAFAGFLAQLPYYAGWLLGVALLPLVIVSALLIIFIGLGGILSVGLIPAAIAVERKGTYDSLGKAFNYIFARPLSLILYLWLLGIFLWLAHTLLIREELVERIMAGTLTVVPLWGSDTYQAIATGKVDQLQGFAAFCGWLHRAVLLLFHLLVWGALISYALGAFTSMFLVFRKDVDGLDYADVAKDPQAA